MTDISSDDKCPIVDETLDTLLNLDGVIMEVGEGYWVKFEARRVKASAMRPFGIDYSLCMFAPDGTRLLCFDNAHPVYVGNGPAKKQTVVSDHVHEGEKVKPYGFTTAEDLVNEFWSKMAAILEREGVE